MKALSIQPFYANLIALGLKFIELRSWKTDYQGWILICSSSAQRKAERESMVSGKAVALAKLADVRPFVDETDRYDAFLFEEEHFEGYSWVFDEIVPIVPFPVKGKLHLFEVDKDMEELERIDVPMDDPEAYKQALGKWWLDHGFIKNLEFIR